jgi:hypothetical protein
MGTAVRIPRQTGAQPVAASVENVKALSLSAVTTQGISMPSRWCMHAPVGFGKTSILAFAPKPIFLMSRGETGLETLIDAGQLPPTPHFPEADNWTEFCDYLKVLRTEKHDYRTLIIDTANGAERLCHEFVCKRDFEGDWGERGFLGYMRGYEVALGDWRLFLNTLDQLRKERNMTIFLLAHTKIKTFRNPIGPDYDRYVPELHEKTWGLTKGWLDNICFGMFETLVKTGTKVPDPSRKGKAAETAPRVLYTNSDNPIFDAKTRLGLPAEIPMGDSPKEGWLALYEAIQISRKKESKNVKEQEKELAKEEKKEVAHA